MDKFPNLFKPIYIGNMLVPNRIVHEPTDVSSSHADGSVSARDIYHHSEIAKGGAGLIIVGATTPDSKTGRPTVTGLVADGDNFIPGLSRLAECMHKYGAKCVVQLQHPGCKTSIPRTNLMSTNDKVVKMFWAAGHEVVYQDSESKGTTARAMTVEEIYEMIELFSEAAWRVKQAGFDGIQLHAAHGYLISDFMSPYLNKRIDRFGGTFENRMRFPLEIIHRIQIKCGKNFPVMVRFNAIEWVAGGRDIEECKMVAKAFENAGVAALDLSMTGPPEAGLNPTYNQQGWTVFAAEEVKKVVSIPVITSHSLRDPEFCENILAEGKADMVGLSRQLLADPYWPLKVKLDKVESIRKCISCLTGCWQESLMAKKEISCSINPACGNIEYTEMKKAEKPLRVAVVGGGPAGMEAARVASTRGHKVTIFEKTGELGGAILGCCLVPGKEKMKWYADWIRREVKEMGIEVKLCHSPKVEELKEYDVVLNATGAKSYMPDICGAGSENVVGFEKVMACPKVNCQFNPGDRKMYKVGKKVLVWGDNYAAADTAAFLASIGKEVTIVTDKRDFGSNLEVIHMAVLKRRFNLDNGPILKSKPYDYPVKVITNSTVYKISEGEVVVIDKEFKNTVLKIDTVVSCLLRPNVDFLNEMKSAGLKVVNVGDSLSPRNLHAAVAEGAGFGLKIDENLLFNSNDAIIDKLPLDVAEQIFR